MELLDIYTENNEPLNKAIEREKVHDEGLWHHEVLIVIMNSKNKVLLEKRSYKSRHLKGKWALCAGHVLSDETEKQAVIRELYEELGIKLLQKDLEFVEIFKKNDPTNKKFSYVYLIKKDINLKDVVLQKEEVTSVKYMSIKRIMKLIKKNDKHFAFADQYHYELFTKIMSTII